LFLAGYRGPRRRLRAALLRSSGALGFLFFASTADADEAATANSAAVDAAPAAAEAIPEQVLVTAPRSQLLGVAETSSQGLVLQQELLEIPAFRPSQLLETVPGLVVTSHSGEGKANQYLLRGFNLDHGTDLATFIDGMPVNLRTQAHGQGYTDLGFFIPELASGINFTKGPYFASEGDFASVGAVHLGYLNEITDQFTATAGTLNYERLFGAGTRDWGGGHVLGAFELVHYDGPWTHPDDFRKVNAVLRYSQGEANEGFSITGMYYRALWNATTDQPVRSMDQSYMQTLDLTAISRWGSLDPTDGGQSQRSSLSAVYSHGTLDWHLDANAYVVNNELTLWNNFTHFLVDPVHGDQEAQHEVRMIYGGGVSYTIYGNLLGANSETLIGVQGRYDDIHVDHLSTQDRVLLPNGILEDDRVGEGGAGAYAQLSDYWTEWFRSIIGVREDYLAATDRGTNTGNVNATLFQPKGSLILTPLDNWEFYLSAGRGFHSDDVRGVTQAQQQGIAGAPLIARSTGEEVGVRTTVLPNLTATLTYFQIDFQSETRYQPDVGADAAGPPSRRTGIEFNTTYQPFEWLEFYTSFAASHARFTTPFDDGTGHIGEYIPNAPTAIGSFAAYLRNLGPWSAGLEYRYLGSFPQTPDNQIRGKGYGEFNLDSSYALDNGWKLSLGIYNLLNTHADAAAFWYIDRLPGEPAGGVADQHIHPLEPISFRFTLGKTF
jgi:outer membrane receptor protein involved in Fe transport